jgi:hypothetical protein
VSGPDEFTSGQIAEIRAALGLKPGDYLGPAAIAAAFDVMAIMDEAAERIAQEDG